MYLKFCIEIGEIAGSIDFAKIEGCSIDFAKIEGWKLLSSPRVWRCSKP